MGPNDEEFGIRFPPMSDAYDLVLRRLAHKVWFRLGNLVGDKKLYEGTYAFVAGPKLVAFPHFDTYHLIKP
jgi:purine-nucleoside phosphorylase